jgi:hypothetical protein
MHKTKTSKPQEARSQLQLPTASWILILNARNTERQTKHTSIKKLQFNGRMRGSFPKKGLLIHPMFMHLKPFLHTCKNGKSKRLFKWHDTGVSKENGARGTRLAKRFANPRYAYLQQPLRFFAKLLVADDLVHVATQLDTATLLHAIIDVNNTHTHTRHTAQREGSVLILDTSGERSPK